jgi:uncharacterized protein YgbK (DUF1537 family)
MGHAAPLLAFYGDDFTGSTDALESAAKAGAKAVLFMEAPTASTIARHPGIQVVGVAGSTRSLVTDELEAELRPALTALRSLGPRHIHYKVCSTFDSSPSIGSIGRATDIGSSVCGGPFVPLLVGAPHLGRYCVFGNLFARMGTGAEGRIYRIDRHPSMSRHPVTPMGEADLRLHLAQQTRKRIGLFDILNMERAPEARRASLRAVAKEGYDVILFDILSEEQLAPIGALIDGCAEKGEPLFSVGSSSIEAALGAEWGARGLLDSRREWVEPAAPGPVLVVSGSCSPVTEQQIARALGQGFSEVALDAAALADGQDPEPQLRRIEAETAKHLRAGRGAIVHTCRGSSDPRLASGAEAFRRRGGKDTDSRTKTSRVLGGALGRIALSSIASAGTRRVVVAGGDTSTYAAKAMGIEALEIIAPVVPGAPLCRVRAPASAADGIEVIFKGGQVGGEDFFERISRGATAKS